jgi:DNA-binding beta-propeller fold protein YncE
VAVNPVTNKIYVTNQNGNSVTVITNAPAYDTKVRAAFYRLPGDTTSLVRPLLGGKCVNRSSPNRTKMMGAANRLNTVQQAWDWAWIFNGAGTDSITWAYTWGTDSLFWGENFLCCAPLEDQAATTNNLGLGTPFAGNLEVYPVYRIVSQAGQEEAAGSEVRRTKLPTIVRGVLFLNGDCPRTGTVPKTVLLDITGSKVLDLKSGANDVRALSPGVYFVREAQAQAQAIRRVVVTR